MQYGIRAPINPYIAPDDPTVVPQGSKIADNKFPNIPLTKYNPAVLKNPQS